MAEDLLRVVLEFTDGLEMDYRGQLVPSEDPDGLVRRWGRENTGVQLWADKGVLSKLDLYGVMRLGGVECHVSFNLAGLTAEALSDAIAQLPLFIDFKEI
jgi:hypothetical protein